MPADAGEPDLGSIPGRAADLELQDLPSAWCRRIVEGLHDACRGDGKFRAPRDRRTARGPLDDDPLSPAVAVTTSVLVTIIVVPGSMKKGSHEFAIQDKNEVAMCPHQRADVANRTPMPFDCGVAKCLREFSASPTVLSDLAQIWYRFEQHAVYGVVTKRTL
jgi:hypothetical protein